MRDDDLMATGLQNDDIDPDGTDIDGMLPLIAEVLDDDRDDDDDERDGRDSRSYSSGADEEEPPLIAPSSIEVEFPAGSGLPDDDGDAYEALTARDGLSPGEAHAYIKYMRPLSGEESEMLEEPLALAAAADAEADAADAEATSREAAMQTAEAQYLPGQAENSSETDDESGAGLPVAAIFSKLARAKALRLAQSDARTGVKRGPAALAFAANDWARKELRSRGIAV
jgi:hypothetical protein